MRSSIADTNLRRWLFTSRANAQLLFTQLVTFCN